MAEESPSPKRIRKKRRSSSASDITIREFGPGTQLFSRYTLIQVLGRGGMGIVWLARDDQLERQVALKFLSEQIIHDHALLADLKRETKRSLELTHPNIVRIHDFVQDARVACISMEYVNGDTLSSLRVSKASHVFEVPDLEPLVAQWCEAMHYAHTYPRVVHCDLKPANLMLNVKGVLKITDFGIARSLSDSASRLTVTRTKSGTLVYMSPQQLNGDPPSVLDDIYSMGATLYELLTGKPPFYRGQIDRQIFDKAPPPIAARRNELGIQTPYIVPLEWEEAIAACLAKEPDGRPQSALSFLKRLSLVSPLRIEKLVVFPKMENTTGVPPAPGEFGLMQDDTVARLQVPVGPQESRPKWEHHVPSIKIDEAPNVARTPDAPHFTTSNVAKMSSVGPASTHPSERRLRRGVALAGFGIIAVVGLWYLVSFVSRSSSTSRTQTVSPNVVTRFVPEKTPLVASTPKPIPEPTPSLTAVPVTVSERVSPSPSAEIADSTIQQATPTPSQEKIESPAPAPKDETTKLRNDLHAAERSIISVHETATIEQRVAKLSPEARANYEKAVTALEQGYLSTAEHFAVEANRIQPDQQVILNLHGLVLSSQKSFEKAEELFARSVAIDRDFRECEYRLGSAAFKKKDYARARKRFEHLASSISSSPNDRLDQLLRYRIYLALLLEGSVEPAQTLMQQMKSEADTPAFYYAHAAWEFRRGDTSVGSQWLDSTRVKYPPELNLVFAEPLSDVGWLKSHDAVTSSPSPTASPSPTVAASPAADPKLTLTETILQRIADPTAAVHLSLKIGVTPKANTPNGRTVDIRVSFFDLTRDNKLLPTNARTAYKWITATRDWSEPTPKYLMATYVRPKMRPSSPDPRKYGGYIVRLYFDGQFQAEKASSPTLLKTFPTDSQAIAPMKTSSPGPASPAPQPSVSGSTAQSLPSDSATPVSSPELEEDAVTQIKMLEQKWAAAIPIHGGADIGLLLADDYEAVTPTGRKLNKSEAINRIKNDTDKYELVAIENMNVRLESATKAIATGLLRQRGQLKSGRAFDRAYHFTDTWVKSTGRWLCVHSRTVRAEAR